MTDIKLFNQDCLEVFKNIPSNSIDLIITDCPYHIISGGCSNQAVTIGRYSQCGGVLNKQSNNAAQTYVKQGKIFEHNDIEFKEWLPEAYRILKPETHCYVMINPRNLKDLWQCAEDAGFTFQQLIVWDKGNTTPNKWYLNCYELILMLRKGKAKNINKMGCKNILRIPNIMRVKQHPTEKPVDLMRVLVENSTQKGEVVMDPFMGVGGVGIACKRTNRSFIGVEIDEKYFSIAQKRIEENLDYIQVQKENKNEIEGQLSLFGEDQSV